MGVGVSWKNWVKKSDPFISALTWIPPKSNPSPGPVKLIQSGTPPDDSKEKFGEMWTTVGPSRPGENASGGLLGWLWNCCCLRKWS